MNAKSIGIANVILQYGTEVSLNTFKNLYWYWYWQYFFQAVLVLVLRILLKSIVNNNPGFKIATKNCKWIRTIILCR